MDVFKQRRIIHYMYSESTRLLLLAIDEATKVEWSTKTLSSCFERIDYTIKVLNPKRIFTIQPGNWERQCFSLQTRGLIVAIEAPQFYAVTTAGRQVANRIRKEIYG